MRDRSFAGLRLLGLGLAWLAGTGAQLARAEVWPAGWALLFGLACLGAAIVLRRHTGACLLLVAAAAFGLTESRAAWRLAEALPPELDGADVELVGTVASLPRQVSGGVRFTFEIDEARWRGEPVAVPRRVSLGWYRGWHDAALLAGPPLEVHAGQRWRLTARLRPPHGHRNPHGFDHELWLFERGIRASGYVRTVAGNAAPRLLAVDAAHPVERARQRVRDAIAARVADPGAAGVLAGLAIGDQSAIERSDWDLFRASGTAHLVAISGLHVTMFAWAAGGLIGWAWRRSARLPLWLPAPAAARWGGVLAAAAYAVFAGWGVPAQRTVWMLAAAAAVASLGLNWQWPLVLLAAAVAVSVADPWALLEPGFWLSFVAVALLIGSEPARRAAATQSAPSWPARAARAVHGALRTQAVATVGLAPLTLVLFQQVSLVGFVANLVAIPLVTLVVTPLALAGIVAPPLWDAAAAAVALWTALLAALTAGPWAVWTAPVAPWWVQAGGLLAAWLAVAPLPARVRLLALPLALPLLWPAVERPPHGGFDLLAADVGQGSAVLVVTQHHALLYDAGPQYSRDSDAGQRVLVPLLHALGVRRLDVLVLSHRDSDHVGGAAAVVAALPVGRLDSSLPADHALRTAPLPQRRCEAGQHWQWDGVTFEVLHPPAEDHDRALRPNALSCVLRVVDAGGRGVLLAGDIEATQEAALVQRHGAALRSDVLLVPHHGSRTSSSAAFVDAVSPRVAVVQAGFANRFGHPAADVLERYAERGIDVVRSDRCGAWHWPAAAAPTCERERRRRYWHHRF
ncbi:DNA internalization-related competence protein ComEC/Rec2 [Azohydromonas sediminis]|uniref:DNA internalization-related competence protein ComEC/Rec2 n=1 Tax=Azohydromonas sediminis TaxID=2259674 RepID=UPI000E655FD8|nr:DNA internalization-related competence protein ComEC/Rec2 [Azohydromonas sediminis]